MLMFGQNACIGEKLKDLKAQLDRSCTFRVMDLQVYPKIRSKCKIRCELYLRWNNSNLIANWETILTLNNYMDEMNSEIISKLQMPCPN